MATKATTTTTTTTKIKLQYLELEEVTSALAVHAGPPCWLNWNLGSRDSRDGAVVRALASHQCVPGSIPGPDLICGLSLLLVLALAPRVFLWVLRFSSKPTLLNSNSIWKQWMKSHLCYANITTGSTQSC